MKKLLSYKISAIKFIIICAFYPIGSLAETITTTDGRSVTLNEDGTYVIEESFREESLAYVEVLDPFFERNVSQYQQESIRFIPIFKNISESDISGIRFTSSFRDAFGDEIFSFKGDVTELIGRTEDSTANVFYVFENNPFINGEAYDKLLPMVTGGTGSVVTLVTGLAMSSGEVVQFE